MKYEVGDRVRIKSLDWYNKNKTTEGCLVCGESHINSEMICMLGKIVTISSVEGNHYRIKEYPWNWTNEMIEGLVEEECPQDFIEKYCKSCGTQRCDRTKEYLNGCPYYNAYRCKTIEKETKPEPKFKRGDFVFSGIDFCAMKVIDRCYDEHWRYRIFDDVNEYWFFEKELKKVEIGDVVYSKVWKEKVIVRGFCDDKFILVADFNGKLLKSLPSLIKQIKDETKPESKFKVGDRVITDTNMKGKIIEVIEEGWYNVEFEPHNGISQPNGVIPEESMSLAKEEMKSEDELLDEYEELTDRAFKGGYEKCKSDIELNGFQLPDGYIFKDENGNVINATKIVLEKKKKEYPKTYEECCKVLNTYCGSVCGYNWKLLLSFQQLLICRDAYWKIAGEEMGLGKPWEPDWIDDEWKWCVCYSSNNIEFDKYKSIHHTFSFPTKEMLDAFYENFKELIEICKELL